MFRVLSYDMFSMWLIVMFQALTMVVIVVLKMDTDRRINHIEDVINLTDKERA